MDFLDGLTEAQLQNLQRTLQLITMPSPDNSLVHFMHRVHLALVAKQKPCGVEFSVVDRDRVMWICTRPIGHDGYHSNYNG